MDVKKKQSVKIIPNWLFKRYVYLWICFKEESFTASDVKIEFKKMTHNILKELVRAGWVIRTKDMPCNSFQAVNLQEIIESIYVDSFIFSDKV